MAAASECEGMVQLKKHLGRILGKMTHKGHAKAHARTIASRSEPQ